MYGTANNWKRTFCVGRVRNLYTDMTLSDQEKIIYLKYEVQTGNNALKIAHLD